MNDIDTMCDSYNYAVEVHRVDDVFACVSKAHCVVQMRGVMIALTRHNYK